MEPPAKRSPVRRAVTLGGALLGCLVLGGLALSDGADPMPPERVCHAMCFGPASAALLGDPAAPWPSGWAEVLARPESAVLGLAAPEGLRCPADTAAAGRPPLESPSFAIMPGLTRDMPPFLIACYETAAHHVWSPRDAPGIRFAAGRIATLAGVSRLFAYQLQPGEDAEQARGRVSAALIQLVQRHRSAVQVARYGLAPPEQAAGARAAIRAGLRASDHCRVAGAAWAAAQRGDRALVTDLRTALRTAREISASEEIARALALLGDRTGVPVLVAAVGARLTNGRVPGDPAPPEVRRARAHAVLVRLAGADHGDPAADPVAASTAWQAWAKGDGR